ncbi:MAG: hypothetical protein NTZ39_11465 [Methanoregula sp.]|nr:hypothetical protein [Methanoregula sp.]
MQQYFKYIFIMLVVFIVVAVFATVVMPRTSVEVPRISAGAAQASQITVSQPFPFEQASVTVIFPADTAVYAGAKSTDKSVTIRGNVSQPEWLTLSYQSMVNDSAQDSLYQALTGEFSKMKRERGLSDDEYVELMTAYVQSLQYVTTPDNPAKFPIETAVDRAGDCDDKSMLLAGLLAHEGYKVALLSFGPESHMSVGIGSDDSLYKDTGYAYIETTNFSFVAIPPDSLRGGIVLRSDPLVVPIGSGTKVYHSGKETRYIEDMYTLSGQKTEQLTVELNALGSELDAQKGQISGLESEMQQAKSSGNTAWYNTQVPVHNNLISEYNTKLATFRDLKSRYEVYADIYNYILGHEYDRKGVYEYVKGHMPG